MLNGSMRVLYNSTNDEVVFIKDHDRIDYVLVRKVDGIGSEVLEFENKLKNYFIINKIDEKGKCFIQITVTEDILKKYCENLKLHLPLKEKGEDYTSENNNCIKKLYKCCIHFCLSEQIFPDREYQLMQVFSQANIKLFNTDDPNFFTPAIKSRIVHHILFKETDISKLLENKEYEATYPVHDGTKLIRLRRHWTSLINIRSYLKFQPLDEIKDYFGIKIALYFAWMSFYSRMLIPASVIGVLFLMYGLLTSYSRPYKFEICNADYVMCPLCDKQCDYWKINESCLYSSITYVFDNSSIVFMTVLMTLWITIYSSLWKRRTILIEHRWGINSSVYENDNFETKLNRVPQFLCSFISVLLLIFILIAITLSLILYRVSTTASAKIFGEDLTSNKKMTITVTGSILEFLSIRLMNHYFTKIAVWLTKNEKHRTRDNYQFHLAWKMFLFGFVNYYSALFYIAFVKGRFGGHPQKHIKLFGYRQEECDPGGCMLELFIQAGVIMLGDLTLYNVMEHLEPFLKRKWRSYSNKTPAPLSNSPLEESLLGMCQDHHYIKDYDLLEWKSTDMIEDYLEMVLQFGLVTLFIAAFPLAPLFAFINNTLEMRLDAKRLLINYRRPVAQNDKDISIWIWFMNFLAKCAVLSNACIIAFTSNFIPQLAYTLQISPNKTAAGFLNYSLSYFDVHDFENNTMPKTTNVTMCRYPDYRNPPGHEKQYELTLFYWHVLVYRLIFVIVFIIVIVLLKMLWKCLVPEMTHKLKKHILNETERAQAVAMLTNVQGDQTINQ